MKLKRPSEEIPPEHWDSLADQETKRLKEENELLKIDVEIRKQKAKMNYADLLRCESELNTLKVKHKEDVIGFADWLSKYEWVKKIKTHPNKVGQYYSYIYCEYKSIQELYEIYSEEFDK